MLWPGQCGRTLHVDGMSVSTFGTAAVYSGTPVYDTPSSWLEPRQANLVCHWVTIAWQSTVVVLLNGGLALPADPAIFVLLTLPCVCSVDVAETTAAMMGMIEQQAQKVLSDAEHVSCSRWQSRAAFMVQYHSIAQPVAVPLLCLTL